MADTHLALANRALQRLGADPITSLDTSVDTSTRAAVMSRLMESTRRTALASHRWNFADARCTLTGFIFIPTYQFSCAYTLPSNLISVNETNLDEEEPYRIEMYVCHWNMTCTPVLVTDSACAPSITYTADLTDITKWTPLFTYALEIQLAADAVVPLGKSPTQQEILEKKAAAAWKKATAKDGQEGKPKRSMLSNSLLTARFGGGRRPDRVNFPD